MKEKTHLNPVFGLMVKYVHCPWCGLGSSCASCVVVRALPSHCYSPKKGKRKLISPYNSTILKQEEGGQGQTTRSSKVSSSNLVSSI